MCEKQSYRVPLKVLTLYSGKLFLLFLLGALLITSLQDLSFKGFIQRTLSLGSLFMVIFALNSFLFHYFDKRRKNNLERIWRKTYVIGYVVSLLYFILHLSIILWLEKKGLYQHPHNVDMNSVVGIRYYAFVIGASTFIYSFIFLIQSSVLTQYESNRIQMELLQLKSSNADTMNQLLRQQIQPHFLFNALNILKSLIKREPKMAENYLLHLSDFLRISISQNSTGISTVADELKICNDYMEMQRIRFRDALQYSVHLPDDQNFRNKKLPFFSLQPILENAIKHNKLTETNPLFITITTDSDFITISNNLQEKTEIENSSGKGLSMLQERYHILNESSPVIRKDENSFSVSLKILDIEYPNN